MTLARESRRLRARLRHLDSIVNAVGYDEEYEDKLGVLRRTPLSEAYTEEQKQLTALSRDMARLGLDAEALQLERSRPSVEQAQVVLAAVQSALTDPEDCLDRDVRMWFAVDCAFPRLTLLGPVGVRAHGVPLARRKPFYTELLSFLAIRPHGATADEIADAFNLTVPRVRNDIKVLRDWLGTNPRTGRKHLPDARDTNAARTRGIGVYQVDDLLTDLDLFDRLRQRAKKTNNTSDLEQALALVTGEPFTHLRPDGWSWLFEGDRVDLHAHHAIIEIRGHLTKHHRRAENLELA